MGNRGVFSKQSQGPEKAKATQTRSGEMEDHTMETTRITTEGPDKDGNGYPKPEYSTGFT
jgi:hypothetical protein